jgi:C1A family cysteine protease
MAPELRRIERFGWKPSLPDARDHVADTSGLVIRDEVDPRKQMPAPYDQGHLGSCTANAVAGAFEYDRILDKRDLMPSRLAIYWFERFLEGSPVNQDTGAFGRDGFKALHQFGVPPESELPYTDDKRDPRFFTDPRKEAKIGDFVKLTKQYKAVPRRWSSMQQALSNRQTIAFGFTVYQSFEDDSRWKGHCMPVPSQTEQALGGHEVLMVGYLKKYPQHALVRNSWGPDWQMGGYFLFPVSLLMDSSFTGDFRTIARPL